MSRSDDVDPSGLSAEERELLGYLLDEQGVEPHHSPPIAPRGNIDELPQSFAQQRLWFLHQLAPNSPVYNVAASVRLRGTLDVAALRDSLIEIARRHETLRTTFAAAGGRPIQIVAAEPSLRLAMVDLLAMPPTDRDNEAARLVRCEALQPFDLMRGPLARVALLQLADDDHVFLLTLHHIIADGWSLGVFIRELMVLYAAFSAGQPPPLPRLPVQYADYALWQRQWLQSETLETQLRYWRERLAGPLPPLELPADRPRPPIQSFRGALHNFILPPALREALVEVSRREGVTLFMMLLAAFTTLLHRYTGQTDIRVGSPTANRTRAEIENLIGFFVNTLVLCTDVSGDPPFRDLLARVRETTLGAYAHQDLPFEKLVEELQPERDLSRNPLFQVLFVLQNALIPALETRGLTLKPLGSGSESAKFDLSLSMIENEISGELIGSLEYSTDLFDAATIARLAEHFRILLEDIAAHPGKRLSELQLLSEAEQRCLLVDWNDTRRAYAQDRCAHELFEAQVERTPEALAVVFDDRHLTYRELNRRADRLAHQLHASGVGLETIVGVCLDRSLELAVALLGVLKAGGAYLPIDPAYPAERLAFMLVDAQISVLLTQSALVERLPAHSARVICIDTDWPAGPHSSFSIPAPLRFGGYSLHSSFPADNLAYIIYTSGSTGQPKGAMLTQRGLRNLVEVQVEAFDIRPGDRVLQFASLSFDASVSEFFTALAAGATLCLPEREELLPGAGLLALLRDGSITTATLPPSTLAVLPIEPLPGLRTLIAAGEVCPAEVVTRWSKGRRFLNAYGPTEATVCATIGECRADGRKPSIGRPIANVQVYVIERGTGQLAPIGVPGELCIGGEGVGRGYLNRPELTAEKFTPPIPLPSKTGRDTEGGRLYHTGDLARWLADGSLEFLGRIDDQVKVRGFRVELGEIEAALNSYPAVRACAVLVHDNRLVAYIVLDVTTSTAIHELQTFLQARLPAHMLPSAFVRLESMPLTPSGKIDRRALPAPERTTIASAVGYVAPRNELERALAGIWQDVLNVAKVGLHDNFFDLGGHSLLLVKVSDEVRTRLNREVSIVDLFRYPTIGALARRLAADTSASAAPSTPARARSRSTGIAVIGMVGRFPGAKTIEQFWQNLSQGIESISFFADEDLAASGIPQRLIDNPNYIRAGGILDDIEWFDAGFFGFTPREAEIMDPQQRIFLECAWEALESVGYNPETYAGHIGVYGGSSLNTYLLANFTSNLQAIQAIGGYQAVMSNDKDHLTTRVSYKLNLKGPSVNVQTTCSSSLVAIHLACRSLFDGECDMALAGGVSISVPQRTGYFYQDGGILSPDGHCRAFDARAQGTVSGQGVGLVVLKRLDDALADGDAIQAVIKGSAINNDGSSKVGYTAPSVEGQVDVIAAALASADVPAETIGYVEAHGTATALGDPIEVAALTQVYRAGTSKTGFCAVGSVKTNIGHLDAAAGVTGLIKTTLALQHRQIPPSLHFQQANPQIDFADSPFYVNAQLSDWVSNGALRRAGVSAFGIGGTNVHLIVEEAPPIEPSGESRAWQLLSLSARTDSALDAVGRNLAACLRRQPQLALADAAYTLHVGRKVFGHRRIVVCRDASEAVSALEGENRRRVFDGVSAGGSRPVAFMFPGQGAQYVDMGRALYDSESVFRAHVDRCAELLEPHLGLDIRQVLYPREEDKTPAAQQLIQTALTQPALFVVEYALAQLWLTWGVRPQAMIGHSLGEYVAACLAGVFGLDDALAIVAARGRLMQTSPAGAMLSVPLPEAELRSRLDRHLSLAAINGPAACVVSGPLEAIAALDRQLAAHGIDCQKLHTEQAFHSAAMDAIVEPFIEYVQCVERRPPQIPFVSNVSGTWITAEEATDPRYWGRHLRQTVRFADDLAEVLKVPDVALLEVGPGHTLSHLAKTQSGEDLALASMRHPQDEQPDQALLLTTLGQLWLAGVEIDWAGFYSGERRRRVALPTYPFERQRYWLEPGQAIPLDASAQGESGKQANLDDWFYIPSWKRSVPPAALAPETLAANVLRWLIFEDGCGLGAKLAGRLETAGQIVTRVREGRSFDRSDTGAYTLNSDRREDYASLLEMLRIDGRLPNKIIHCWNVTADDAPHAGDFDRAQALGFYSLLYLAQIWGLQNVAVPLDIVMLSDQLQAVSGEENLRPEKATLLGPCRVTPQEYPNIACRSIDVTLPAANSWREAKLLDHLLAEIASPSVDPVVAYRGSHRWVQSFEPVQDSQSMGRQARLREGGVYLITGGLGSIGLALAEHLARTEHARLALLSRSALPPRNEWEARLASVDDHAEVNRKIRKIVALESLGAEVMVLSADVADETQMRVALQSILDRFGALHGVIHAAGLTGRQSIHLLQEIDRSASEAQFQAKARGLYVLANVLRGIDLDFCYLQSSLAVVLGGLGFAAYSAANAFMDAFAQWRNQIDPVQWTSVNWDGWSHPDVEHDSPWGARVAELAMTPDEGRAAFQRLLSLGSIPQVVISTSALRHRLREWVRPRSAGEPKPQKTGTSSQRHPRPELSTEYLAPRDAVERKIAGVWENMLGIEPIGVDDNLFALGGHSLLAVQIVSRMREIFQIELPLRTLFDRPTIAGLALAVTQGLAQATDRIVSLSADSERLLSELDNLSEAEVDSLLDKMLAEDESG